MNFRELLENKFITQNKELSKIKIDLKNDKGYVDYTIVSNTPTFEFKSEKTANKYFKLLSSYDLSELKINKNKLTASI